MANKWTNKQMTILSLTSDVHTFVAAGWSISLADLTAWLLH